MSVIPYPQSSVRQHVAPSRLHVDGQTLGSSLLINLLTWFTAAGIGGLSHWLSGDYRVSLSLTAALLIAAPLFWAWLQYRRPAATPRAGR